MQRVTAYNRDPQLLDRLAGALYFRAELRRRMGDSSGALADYRQAITILEGAGLNRHLAVNYGGVAVLLNQNGNPAQAVTEETKAVELIRQLSKQSPENAVLREYLGEALGMLSDFQIANKNGTAGLATAKQEHEIFRQLVRSDPRNSLANTNFALSDLQIGTALLFLQKPASALPVLQEAVSHFEAMSPQTASDRNIRTGLATSYCELGQAHAALAAIHNAAAARKREWREARLWYRKSSSIWKDKRRRGEVESSELNDERKATDGISQSEAALAAINPG
jgi:tetratricopeptide (TPR) repeat protein